MRTFSTKDDFPGVSEESKRLKEALRRYINYTGNGIARFSNTSWWGSNPIFTLDGDKDFINHCLSKLNRTYIDPLSKCYKLKCGSDTIYVDQINVQHELDNDIVNKFNK